ncbi:MAG: thioredoxin family protein [Planctomycetota bacterium]
MTRAPLRALALILIGCLGAAQAHAQPAPPPYIAFRDVEDTLALAAEQAKPVVLYFTADWCGPCRRMQAEAFADPAVVRASKRFVWTKIDIDKNQPLAARFAVRGVPSFIFLDQHGRFLDQATGYRTRGDFLELLNSRPEDTDPNEAQTPQIESVRATLEQLEPLRGEPWRETMRSLIDQLATAEHQGRSEAREALLAMGDRAHPVLLDAMSSDRLAVRAAAHDLILLSTPQPLAYDPFAPADQRAAQLAAWRTTLAAPTTQPADDASAQAPDR